MKKTTKDKLNTFLFNFKDLTSLGGPKTSFNSLINNERIYKLDPSRFNFYMQVLESISNPNPDVLTEVIKKENITRYEREQMEQKLNNIQNYFEVLEDEGEPVDNSIKKLNTELGINPLTQDFVISKADEKIGGQQIEGDDIQKLKNKLDLADNGDSSLSNTFENKNKKTKDEIVRKYNTSPYYSPKNENVNITDRLIFVILTYIIRALALFFVEWGTYTGYITTFNQAFGLYFGIYACIFFLVVFLTNGKREDMVFRMLFFYMNTQSDDGKGILRILVHILCILLLLPIPLIVREYKEFKSKDILSFKEKSKLLNGIQTFSLYSWILTSIISLNV